MPDNTPELVVRRPKILFLCCGNTCRSVLAKYLARHRCSERFDAESAGLHPQTKSHAENAIWTLRESFNIDASGHEPQSVSNVDLSSFHSVIALDLRVERAFRSAYPDFPSERLQHWNVSDPYGDNLEEYKHCALTIWTNLSALKI